MNKSDTKFLFAVVVLISLLVVQYGCLEKVAEDLPPDYSGETIPPAPVWARNGTLYQVFPRVYTQEGTFRALQQKLDYIDSLQVDIIWLLPIYPIGEKGRKGTLGSPFAIRDFRAVNPEYGTKEDFRDLVNAIHARGMHVIIGMVPNHAANDNVLMKAHPDWFMRDAQGNFTREVADWSDITDFNYDNEELRRYMIETMKYWIREFDIDGYRCDVAGMVPVDFWEEALPELHKLKSDIYLLAEWESPALLMAGFNSDYSWSEYHIMTAIRNGERRTVDIVSHIEDKQDRYPENALPMRFLENHDEQRSLKVFGPEAIEAYATLLFTAPGIPLIYAGQEMGETEKPSLFDKSQLNRDEADPSLLNLYKSLITIRKKYDCFTTDTFYPLQTASFKGSAGAFLRFGEEHQALVVCNLQNRPVEKLVVTMPDSLRKQLRPGEWKNYLNDGLISPADSIYIEAMPGFTTWIYLAE
ncbi:MAG: alpha-amylase family glycosyl hydrolase [Calditrichia bacterium]